MIAESEIKNPEAIEKYFCVPFKKSARHEMSLDLTEMLVILATADKDVLEANYKDERRGSEDFIFELIMKRVKHCFTYNITDFRLIFFLGAIAKSAGTAVMYLTYLQYWCKKHNVSTLDWETFNMRVFPDGFLSEKDLQKLWDGQKVNVKSGSDNLLDYQSAMLSIHFVKPEKQPV